MSSAPGGATVAQPPSLPTDPAAFLPPAVVGAVFWLFWEVLLGVERSFYGNDELSKKSTRRNFCIVLFLIVTLILAGNRYSAAVSCLTGATATLLWRQNGYEVPGRRLWISNHVTPTQFSYLFSVVLAVVSGLLSVRFTVWISALSLPLIGCCLSGFVTGTRHWSRRLFPPLFGCVTGVFAVFLEISADELLLFVGGTLFYGLLLGAPLFISGAGLGRTFVPHQSRAKGNHDRANQSENSGTA